MLPLSRKELVLWLAATLLYLGYSVAAVLFAGRFAVPLVAAGGFAAVVALAFHVAARIEDRIDDARALNEAAFALYHALQPVAPLPMMSQYALAPDSALLLHKLVREKAPRVVVDLTFDAFDREGAGALASWMLLSGNSDALDPVVQAIHHLVQELSAADPKRPQIPEHTLMLVLTALGDSLLGGQMAKALGLSRETARVLATRNLLASFALAESHEVQACLTDWLEAQRARRGGAV